MKIALVTTQNANNYGAILQGFALQEVLSVYGDVEIINYDNAHIGISFDLIRVKPTIHGLLGAGKDIFRLFPRYRAIKKFKKFIQNYMKLTKVISLQELQNGDLAFYDVYIAGSDQIWNPACISKDCMIDPIYFLNFVPKEARKISYASSMGGYQMDSNEIKYVKKLLKDFHMISVREKDTQNSMQTFLKKTVNHVLDPTLLLSKEVWLESFDIDKPVSDKGYILLYTVPKSLLIRKAVDYFVKKTGLRVIALDQGLTAGANVDQQVRDAGPVEFLELFSKASFVVTDSFHGTCFSINFKKPFIVTTVDGHSNRIVSLLKLLELENRLVSNSCDFETIDLEIDFERVAILLEAEKKKSLDYICLGLGSVQKSVSLY